MEGWDGTLESGESSLFSKQGPAASETVSHMAIRRKTFSCTRKSKHEHPKPAAHLVCSQISKKASTAGVLGKETCNK